MQKSLILNLIFSIYIVLGITACKDDIVNSNPDGMSSELPENISAMISDYNSAIAAYQKLFTGKHDIIDCIVEENGGYRVMFSDKDAFTAYSNENLNTDIPVFAINEDGFWIYTLNGEEHVLTDTDGNMFGAILGTAKTIVTPKLSLSNEGKWLVSFNGVQWNELSDFTVQDIENKKPADFALYKTVSYDDETRTLQMVSRYGTLEKTAQLEFIDSTPAWRKFVMKSEDNLLLDFSYAGYKHGEVAPPDGFALGYKVVNIAQEMVARGKNARETFIEVLQENKMTANDKGNQNNPNARVVLYFPEGNYVLHDESDNVDDKTNSIIITAGNFVIKGAGRDKTKLEMRDPAMPDDPSVLYSSPDMILIKHNSGTTDLCDVVSDAPKGTFSVEVSSPELVNIGDWVCLYLLNSDSELIAKELYPHQWEDYMENISEGINVIDYHQVIGKNGKKIIFNEPIMHEVEARWGWKIRKYPHYENVGIEDLSFVGHAKENFVHHGSWQDDGAYKPVSFMRLVNSWIRRVDFCDVSEAMSISSSSNCSAYDINITGNRGHAAIRSAGSSRVFIGAVTDRTTGPSVDDSSVKIEDAGQYHACGVSKQSMGAVIWNVHWGTDGCFEAHATQPRATLIDNCQGGFMQSRQGGDSNQVPNHLADLTIWNMNVERTGPLSNKGDAPADGKFDWWRYGSDSSERVANNWKFLPPVVVGMHGVKIGFVQDEKQIKLDESNGTKVEPESLYEAQLKLRLGYVPSWLLELKGNEYH